MTDLEFITRFEKQDFTGAEWTHENHLRMAWYYLNEFGLREATLKSRMGIQALNAKVGTTGRGYHETITVFFLKLIDYYWNLNEETVWTSFIKKHPFLMNSKIIFEYYSNELVESSQAKTHFVEPNLKPIPQLTLSIRDFEEKDIPLVLKYWATLTQSDIDRMYIDVNKLPSSNEFAERLKAALNTPPEERKAISLIWQVGNKVVGILNSRFDGANGEPRVHLHMFDKRYRGRNLGPWFFVKCVTEVMKRFNLDTLYCEPASTNIYPNRLLEKLGFPIEKTYQGIASPICTEQPIHRYKLEKSYALSINLS